MSLYMHRIKNKRWVILLMIATGYLSVAVLYTLNKTLLISTRLNQWVLSKTQPRVPLLLGGIHGLKTKCASRKQDKG